jgi:hypothetical protein
MYQQNNLDKEKSKPLTYEQIRDIVLERKEDVKEMTRSRKKVTVTQKPKKVHNFEFV